MKTESKENYLKALYHLQKDRNRAVKSVELAKKLGFSKASVSGMIKKLAKEGLVEYKLYSTVTLAKKGIEEAEKIIYKHKLLEGFLSKILGIGKNKVHDEADKLEHDISDEAAEKIDKILKSPRKCPHGYLIPKKDKKTCLLYDACIGKGATVLFTKIKNKKLLERINSMGFVPEAKIRVLNKVKNGPIQLEIKNCKVALGRDICCQIYVKEE